MQEAFSRALHRFLILTVSLSCLAAGSTAASRPSGPLCGMDARPFADSIQDRQLNRLDNGLLAFTNRNNRDLFRCSTLPGYGTADDPARAHRFPAHVPSRTAFSRSTCLRFPPLLPIPPPQA